VHIFAERISDAAEKIFGDVSIFDFVAGLVNSMISDVSYAFTSAENIIPNTMLILSGQIEGVMMRGEMTVPAVQNALTQILMKAVCILWLIGVAITISKKLVHYTVFKDTLARHSQQYDLPEKYIIHMDSRQNSQIASIMKTSVNVPSEVAIPEKLEVRATSLIEAPLIIGLVHPVLYLPFSVKAEKLDLILRHELTHYRRRDILYKWCAMVILTVHWFNPISHIVSKQIDEECEISCDYEATRGLLAHEKASYMGLILDLLSHSERSSRMLTTQMSSSGKMLKRRFEMIKDPAVVNKKRKTFSVIFACVLIIVTLFAGIVLASSIDGNESGAGNDISEDSANNTEIGGQISNITDADWEVSGDYGKLPIPVENQVAFVWMWPVPSSQEISYAYQVRTNPATGEELHHYGIDIKAETGEDVVSAMKGTVVEAGYDRVYGNCVRIAITLNDVEIDTFYGHMSEITCEVGDEVMPGDAIGKIGSTGASTGPHLHFEIKNDGEYIDPLTYYPVDYEVE
ncbi:MAG: peptidoglycan DD-metalloendopeptidase family protein, partial [Firmicutes bacterium]|nr:peptidoglycan DD-metalloendopeptidase family protein [Bacillota bacterium]